MSIINDALFYADLNVSVHPLLEGPAGSDRAKRPNYEVESSTDPSVLREVLRGHQGGIGGTLPRGMIALDIDVFDRKKQQDKLGIRQLEQLNDLLGIELRSLTRTHLSGSRDSQGHRGQHLLFTVDPDLEYSLIGVAKALGLASTKQLDMDLRGNGRGNLVLPHTAGYGVSSNVTELIVAAPTELSELLAVSEFPEPPNNPQLVLPGSGVSALLPKGVRGHWSSTTGDLSLEAYFGIRTLIDMGWTVEQIQAALLSQPWGVLRHYKEHWRDWTAGARADVANIDAKVRNGLLRTSDNRSAAEQLAGMHDAMQRPAALQLWRAEPIAERVLLAMTEISAQRKSMKVMAPQRTIARRVGAGLDATQRAFTILKDAGWIRVFDQGGAGKATEWRLVVPVGLAAGPQERSQRVLPKEDSWQVLFGRGGLPRPALRILERLLTGVVETRKEIGDALNIPKGSVSKGVKAFIELGLVEEIDGRAIALVADLPDVERICRAEARRLGILSTVRRRNKGLREDQAVWKGAQAMWRSDRVLEVLEDDVQAMADREAEPTLVDEEELREELYWSAMDREDVLSGVLPGAEEILARIPARR